jgi:hypothetical protein
VQIIPPPSLSEKSNAIKVNQMARFVVGTIFEPLEPDKYANVERTYAGHFTTAHATGWIIVRASLDGSSNQKQPMYGYLQFDSRGIG